MKKILKSFLLILVVALISMSQIFVNVKAEEASPSPEAEPTTQPITDITANGPGVNGQTAVLIDLKSGQVLYRKNADQQMTPAGIQKILTNYIVVQNLDSNESIKCSEEAIFGFDRKNTHIWLTQDEVITASDAEYASMLESANDATRAEAEAVAGDQESFVALMNQVVSDLGLTNTHFANTTGISEDNNYTSAYDMAVIARLALSNEELKNIFFSTTYAMNPTNKQSETRYFAADNELVKQGSNYYEQATGGKVGWSDEGGYTLVATSDKDNLELLVVVMGCETTDQLYADAKALFSWGYGNFKTVTINRDDIGSKQVEIKKNGKLWATADFTIDVDFNILLKSSDDETGITTDIEVRNENNPEKVAAYVIIYKDGQQIAEKEMNKNIQMYDISFAATTLPVIMNFLDLFCVGVLAVFILGKLVIFLQRTGKTAE